MTITDRKMKDKESECNALYNRFKKKEKIMRTKDFEDEDKGQGS